MNQQSHILHIKIPVALAGEILCMREKRNSYETNRTLKNFTSFLILKAASTYGVYNNYRKQIGYIATLCQCSKQTMFKRLAWMESETLLQFEGGNIRLNGWKHVATKYGVSLKQFKTIHCDTSIHKNLHLHFFAAEIEENKKRQAYMIERKLNKNSALKNAVQNVCIQFGADKAKIENFAYLHKYMQTIFTTSFIAKPDIHNLLINVRPDCNRSVKTLAAAWEFKSPQSVSYYKAKLAAEKIASIDKGKRITSQTRARNEAAHVIWNKSRKQTVLCLVDHIEILQQNPLAA